MKNKFSALLILGPLLGLIAGVMIERQVLNVANDETHKPETALEHSIKHLDPTYVCPMHPEILSNEEGTCPICGMDLVAVKKTDTTDNENNNSSNAKHPVVKVSPEIINSLGVRTVKLSRKDIARRVETPGFVQQIKKGRMTTYRSPFEGTISKVLFEAEHWYEKTGIPLLELTSNELFEAQTQHLQIYTTTAPEDKRQINNKEKKENKEIKEITKTSSSVANESSFFDKEGKLTEEYRNQLFAMGHTEASILEMEKEMLSSIKVSDKEKKPEAIEKTVEKIVGKEIIVKNDAEKNTILSLEDSRNKLRSLGMRNEDITKLETTGVASNKLILYTKGNGRVIDTQITQGTPVSKGERLFRYGGEVRAVVLANAFQRDAAWITTGQKVDIRMPHAQGDIWPGVVNQGAVSINPDSQNIGIRISFTAPLNKVRSNMYVLGTIYGDTRKDVIAVPTQSIIRTEGENRIIVALGDGRFKPVTVKVGVEAGNETEIVEGLKEGDEVVVMAQFLIDSESSLQASLQRLNSM